MRVGFLGLGGMGAAMAANLIKAGHEVTVWNRSPAPADRLAAMGGRKAESPAAAAGGEILISMLADDAATKAVLVEGGALDRLAAGALHVNMATVSMALAKELTALHEARGQGYVAAPVLGRVDVAVAGKLNILAAGPAALLDRAEPLFAAMGQRTWRFGERPEQANAVKLAANFMLASAIEAMGEAAALVQGHEVAPASFLEMISSTLFAAPAYKGYGAMIAEKRYSPVGFKLPLGLKDVRLAQEAGFAANVPMPFASVIRDNFLDALANGDGELDWAALAKVAARRAGQQD
ncbi:3-hydroxyisobutyrate dehydrogenase [Arboricoccus pini]|uniref:3-hydroxyisobutyrate dehydrogenase n=1 Tax=Arboricoccus pini TaxID=1963835 RepID=A0A212RHS2_9PROT|nr:NAD(P)-dependent oxidoreductase [Arboricoccus pini]SNB71919.1 3-hydroxyisobutyrate dehydrogenase [Arboricoccus pini]